MDKRIQEIKDKSADLHYLAETTQHIDPDDYVFLLNAVSYLLNKLAEAHEVIGERSKDANMWRESCEESQCRRAELIDYSTDLEDRATLAEARAAQQKDRLERIEGAAREYINTREVCEFYKELAYVCTSEGCGNKRAMRAAGELVRGTENAYNNLKQSIEEV